MYFDFSLIFQFLQFFRKFFNLQMRVVEFAFGFEIFFPFVRIRQSLRHVFVERVRHQRQQIAQRFLIFQKRLNNRVSEFRIRKSMSKLFIFICATFNF